MKKIFSLLLAVTMIFSLGACGGSNQNESKEEISSENIFTVTLKDGTSEEMTYEDLSALYDNELKLEKYLGAKVSGSGEIESIEKDHSEPDNATIKVGFMQFEIHNVPTDVAMNYNVGDTIPVKGELVRVFGTIVYLNGHGYYN